MISNNSAIMPFLPKSLKRVLVSIAYYIYNAFITHIPFYKVREIYLVKILGYKIGRGVAIHMGCFFTGRDVVIGNNSVINRNCYLDGRGGLTIGKNASISPECYIISLTHDINSPLFDAIPKAVFIGDRVWLGARSLILPGVNLNEGVVVGAGSVVSKSYEAFEVVAGVPAKKIGERTRNLNFELSYFPLFNGDV